ncbi:uncharacterized protein LOC127792382 [Diospyros lotus]|uniref:uncharacterized protein LOC127792382 n=1 Tax=Diospyros lotus TaxID=55363 RepID=UPI002253645A|nr:uncharacterized protein LOC127792382 [Diospyros lotus]
MNILQYPEGMNALDLQIWNNAVFDNGESEDTAITRRSSLSPLKTISVNRSESLGSVSSKENQSPVAGKSSVSIKTPAQVKPLQSNGVIGNSQGKPMNPLPKKSLIGNEAQVRDERKIDAEIEEIQMEISRLSSRLEALRLEKAEQKLKALERRGRVIPAKFMEQKQNGKNSDGTKLQRRGVSLGPAEILAAAKFRQQGKHEITPVQAMQSRRKSCFWKLQDIEEEKPTKERGKSLSISPKTRKTISKAQARQAATTVGPKKGLKKEDGHGILSTIQPKKLFKDGEKSAPAKKPVKPGRFVASRYAVQSTVNSAVRKRSFPENGKDDSKRCDKKRVSSSGRSSGSLPEINQSQETETMMKKKGWEIPGEVEIDRKLKDDQIETPLSASKMPDLLPRIRTLRSAIDSPRDSGPAKRISELIGRKSYFGHDDEDEEAEPPICQSLSFAEEEEEEERK